MRSSAPDHAHFQAGNKGFMPIEQDWRGQVAGKVADYGQATLWYLNDSPRTTLVIESADRKQRSNCSISSIALWIYNPVKMSR